MTISTVRLDFFGLAAELRSDVPHVTDYCRELFGAFVVERDGPVHYRLEIVSRPDGAWVVRDPQIQDAVVREAGWLAGIVTARLLEAAGNEVEDRYLLHAAALARGDAGLILAGESGFGKSTLALGLVTRGFRLLSDEVAVVDARDGRLLPFPKALELRPETASRFGIEPSGPSRRAGKRLYDLSRAFPASVGLPCTPRAVVFLEEPPQEPASGPRARRPTRDDGKPRAVRLRTHDRDDRVATELVRLDGVAAARWEDGAATPTLVLEVDPLRFRGWEIEDVLGRRGLLVVSSSFDVAPPRDFDRPPRLEALSTHVGVAALLARFRGSRALARHVERHGGFGGLFVSFVDRLDGARFYRLSPGRLDESLAALETALDRPRAHPSPTREGPRE